MSDLIRILLAGARTKQDVTMSLPGHVSCLLLLSLGTPFPADGFRAPGPPGEEFQVIPNEPGVGEEEDGGPKWRRSPIDLKPLFSIAKELQSFGKEKAGIQFRFGRQDVDGNPNGIRDLPEGDGEKGALAEQRDGHPNRKKPRFSTWFGRKRREALWAKGSFPGSFPKLTGSI
ncbi:PREDICTED: orexigenic neuropeptide QRFP [Thamnophis sirtalis]|uniref:Orexigenic neuropeptide QRFP n=1 Tax=Thamnophis sirtalis TaxID=35019 RepID=A0A6I9YZC1_9SAUR|nr:PREDICTED: orexigenic neuropeptide QRFP [Thamnophis sirtalis]